MTNVNKIYSHKRLSSTMNPILLMLYNIMVAFVFSVACFMTLINIFFYFLKVAVDILG